VLTYALAFFVAATVAQEFARGMQARHILHGEARATAFVNLLRRSGRRYGGYIVHLGIVVIAVAVATSQAGSIQVEKTLTPGDSVAVGPYTVTLASLRSAAEPQRDVLAADLLVTGNGANERLQPALVSYPNSTQAVGSPGIAAGARDDIYTILVAYDARANAWATIRVLVIPLVSWLWAGGAIIGLGAVIAALPQPKRRAAEARSVPADARVPVEV
jgi:cytochrome c-type biogenesis protein CcmF